MQKDIFEDMKNELKCLYISDLRNLKVNVYYRLLSMPLDCYSKDNIKKFCNYIFGENSKTYELVMRGKR